MGTYLRNCFTRLEMSINFISKHLLRISIVFYYLAVSMREALNSMDPFFKNSLRSFHIDPL